MAVPSQAIEITSSPGQAPPASTSHRLPTVSASKAFQELQTTNSKVVQIGLPLLDSLLSDSSDTHDGGIEHGKVTELWGPRGAGKTAIALQAAARVIKDSKKVLWVDTATTLSESRLRSVLSSKDLRSSSEVDSNCTKNFIRVSVPTLSHLLAIVLHPPTRLISSDCDLLVIDDLNGLIDLDYPRYQFITSNKTEQQKWQAGRRYAVLGSLITAINKLAVLHDLAAIVTTGCSTRMRLENGLGAALGPGIGGTEWDGGIWNRLAVFRDFRGRYVGLQKCQGKSLISREEIGDTGSLVGFDVGSDGVVRDRQVTGVAQGGVVQQVKPQSMPLKPRKRNFDEIADSEGEDTDEYGWAENDEEAFAAEGLIDAGNKVDDGM